MTDIPSKEPTKMRAGDTIKWTKSLSDYPASIWTLTYSFVNAEYSITVVATADEDDFEISILPSESSEYVFGRYEWIARVSDGTDTYTIGNDSVYIQRNLAVGPIDLSTQNEKILDALNAMIENKASKDQQSLSIEGRQLQRYSFPDLIAAQKHYKQLVGQERRAANLAKSGNNTNLIRTRF